MLRTAPSALSALALITVLMGLSVGCCHYPKGRVTQLTGPSAQAPTLTVIAYGDTRTGPLGLGDNAKQAVHGKVVDDVFAQNRNIDAVIFTGDAVMSNFIAWRKDYWRCFLKQAHRFRAHDVPFYPTLGNHEVLPAIVPLIKVTTAIATGFSATQAPPPSDKRSPVARAYDSGEEP